MENEIPEDVGRQLVSALYHRKLIAKVGGKKVRGKVVECCYTNDHCIFVKLDNSVEVLLDMNSYIKVLK